MKKKKLISRVAIGLVVLIAGACYMVFVLPKDKNDTGAIVFAQAAITPSIKETLDDTIVVHVCGSVVNSGVYTLKASSRIMDAIAAAGGFTLEAAKDALNLAATLRDEQRVYVPSQEEVSEDMITYTEGGQALSQMVNLNTATKEQLMTLPGIGETKANSILEYRKEYGAFSAIEDIMKIQGIKQSVFERLKERIYV